MIYEVQFTHAHRCPCCNSWWDLDIEASVDMTARTATIESVKLGPEEWKRRDAKLDAEIERLAIETAEEMWADEAVLA